MSSCTVCLPCPPKADSSSSASVGTPINIILLALFVLIVYLKLRPAPAPTLPRAPAPTVFRTYTPRTLLPFNGAADGPIYVAVRGHVYDVTPGRQFYGPGGPYANFAGRDASRGLACQSFDAEMLTADLDGPLDTLADLGAPERDALAGWEETFRAKYLRVGRLVAAADEGKKET